MSAAMKSNGLHVWMVTALATIALAACGGTGDLLPGRTRAALDHDWPHPRDLDLDAATFAHADPSGALFKATSGVQAYIIPGPTDPLVRITAALPLGRLHEAAGEAGASALLTQILTTRGAVGGKQPLSLRLAGLGTGLDVEQTLDMTRISLNVLPEDWRDGLELLVGLLRNPDLSASMVQQYRAGQGYTMPMAGIGGDGFRPKVELERRVYGYPLAPPSPGTRVSLSALRSLASRTLRADRVVLGVGGNIELPAVEGAVEATTRGWPRTRGGASPPVALAPQPLEGGLYTVDVPSLEGWVAIGKALGAIPETDRAALAALRFILSERLNIAAREIRGLTNRDAFLLPETGSGTGLVHIRTGGRPEAVAPLVRFSLEEVLRLHDAGEAVHEDEVTRARGWLVQAEWRGRLEGASKASETFAVEQVRHGGTSQLMQWPEAVGAVTAADIKDVAARYLEPSGMVTVVAGPLARIRAARHPRWPVALTELEEELGQRE